MKIELESVAVDATVIEAKGGEVIGVDGHKRRKGTKAHTVVTGQAIPLTIRISSLTSLRG